MRTLLVIAYDDMFKAEEVRLTLQKLRLSYLVDLDRHRATGDGS